MAAPIIRSNGTISGPVIGLGRNNLVVGETVYLTDTNPDNVGASYFWELEDVPIGSASALAGATTPTASFIPDRPGSYRVRCTVGGVYSQEVLAVPLPVTGARIPSFLEETWYDGSGNVKGWHEAMTAFMIDVDTRLGNVTPPVFGAAGLLSTIDIGDTAVAGVSTAAARADHQHVLPAPTTIANINGTVGVLGVSTKVAREDHSHFHGNLAGGLLHDPATTTVAGFMSAADKAADFLTTTAQASLPNSRRLVAGTNVTLVPAAGTLTINATGGVGTGTVGRVPYFGAGGAITEGAAAPAHIHFDSSTGRLSPGGGTLGYFVTDGGFGTRMAWSTVMLTIDSIQMLAATPFLWQSWSGDTGVEYRVHNSSLASTANATLEARVSGSTGGNPRLRLNIAASRIAELLLDNAASDTFKINIDSTTRLSIDGSGNVVLGTGALATTATDGFLYITGGAGTPTGTPTTYTGRTALYFDTTANLLYANDGGGWTSTGGGGGGVAGSGTAKRLAVWTGAGAIGNSTVTVDPAAGITSGQFVVDPDNTGSRLFGLTSYAGTTGIPAGLVFHSPALGAGEFFTFLPDAFGTAGKGVAFVVRDTAAAAWKQVIKAENRAGIPQLQLLLDGGLLAIGSSFTPTGDVHLAKSTGGGSVALIAENTSNTASSHAVVEARVGGTSAGNPELALTVPGGYKWRLKANNAGTRDYFTIGYDVGATSDAKAVWLQPQTSDIDGVWVGINTTAGPGTTFHVMERVGDNSAGYMLQGITNATQLSYTMRTLDVRFGGMEAYGSTASGSIGGESVQSRFGLADNASFPMAGMFLATRTATAMKLITNDTIRLTLDAAGNVVVGTGALATTATAGFIYVTGGAGAPTGAPTSYSGRTALYYDTAANVLYANDGGGWASTGGGGGGLSGTGAVDYLPIWSGTSSLSYNSALYYSGSTDTLTVSKTKSGGTLGMTLQNVANTASSDTLLTLQVGGTSGGSPRMNFVVPSGATWQVYVDNADGDTLKIRDPVNGETRMAFRTTAVGSGAGAHTIFGRDTASGVGYDLEVYSRQSTGHGSIGAIAAAGQARLAAYNTGLNAALEAVHYGSSAGGDTYFGQSMNGWSLVRAFGATSGLALGLSVSAPLLFGTNNLPRLLLTAAGNVSWFNGTGSFGGGVGVTFQANATTEPTSAPSGGGLIWVHNGQWKVMGTSGVPVIIS